MSSVQREDFFFFDRNIYPKQRPTTKDTPSVRFRAFCVVCFADNEVERAVVSVVQTTEQSVERYIHNIKKEQANVDACTRLVDAECMLKLFITVLLVSLSMSDADARSSPEFESRRATSPRQLHRVRRK